MKDRLGFVSTVPIQGRNLYIYILEMHYILIEANAGRGRLREADSMQLTID